MPAIQIKKTAIASEIVANLRRPNLSNALEWSRRQESNLYLALRRRPFYPLNYGEAGERAGRDAGAGEAIGTTVVSAPDFGTAPSSTSPTRHAQMMSSESSSPLCRRTVRR